MLSLGKKKRMALENEWLKNNFHKYKGRKELYSAFCKEVNNNFKLEAIIRRCNQMNLKFREIGFKWNDNPKCRKWLENNYNNYESIVELHNAFNEKFKMNLSYSAIKAQCSQILNLRIKPAYTKKQIEWLKENYKNYSYQELANQFNKIFNENKKPTAIKCYCNNCLKIYFSDNQERIKQARTQKSLENKPIGTIRTVISRKHKRQQIKLANGKWVDYARYINGTTNEDEYVFIIDESKPITKENTIIADKRTASRMRGMIFHQIPTQLKPLAFKTCKLQTILKGE